MSIILNIYKSVPVEEDYSVDRPLGRVLWPGNESTGEVRAIFDKLEREHFVSCPDENLVSFLGKNGFIPLPTTEAMVYI
jgi:hypothetical protein